MQLVWLVFRFSNLVVCPSFLSSVLTGFHFLPCLCFCVHGECCVAMATAISLSLSLFRVPHHMSGCLHLDKLDKLRQRGSPDLDKLKHGSAPDTHKLGHRGSPDIVDLRRKDALRRVSPERRYTTGAHCRLSYHVGDTTPSRLPISKRQGKHSLTHRSLQLHVSRANVNHTLAQLYCCPYCCSSIQMQHRC